MAIIDAKGLFYGDRLSSCSDEAQLFWPRYYLAANSIARMELDYGKMLAGPLKSLHKKPSESQWVTVMREYHEKHLMFIYQSDGQLWGQFDTDPSNLPRYTTRDANRSPAPPDDLFAKWKDDYSTEKATRNSKGFLDLLKCTEIHGESQGIEVNHRLGVGVGVGVGIGVGKELLSEPKNGSDVFQFEAPPKNGNGKHSYDDIIREEIFPYYVTRCDRHPVAYKLTPLRMKKGVSRFEDALTITENDIEKAKALMKCAIDAIAENPFNMGQNEQKTTYCDWIDHIFKSTERFQKLIG